MAENDHQRIGVELPPQQQAGPDGVETLPVDSVNTDEGNRTRFITWLIVVCVSLLLIWFGTVPTHSYLRNSNNRVVESVRDVGLRDLWARQADNLPSFGPSIFPKIIYYRALATFLIACTILVWYALAPNRAWLPHRSSETPPVRPVSEISEGSGAGS